MRRLLATMILLPALYACGVDCEELCEKIQRCRGGAGGNDACNVSRCIDNCELQEQYGSGLRFEDQAACTLDASCEQLENNACYYQTFQLGSWCL